MEDRFIFTCLSSREQTQKLYTDSIKPLFPDCGRLRLISYLDFPIRDEFNHEIRTLIHLSNAVIVVVDRAVLNVIYEIGVADGHGKPVILVAPNVDEPPTMLRSRNVLTYNKQDPASDNLQERLEKVLKATLQGTFIDQRFQDHISVLINKAVCRAPSNEPPAAGSDDLEAGIHYYHVKNYEKAGAYLERAMQDGSRNEETYFLLADAFFLLGESLSPGERQRNAYQKMQHFSREGTKLHAKDKRLRKTFGLSCMKLGDFDRAENIFNELLAEDPEYTVATYNLACSNALQQKKSHCVRYLSDLFSRNPEWRYLARLDSDFDGVWTDELIQRLMFPCPINK
jgi:tetratricopeptide (TPR) repeat protein